MKWPFGKMPISRANDHIKAIARVNLNRYDAEDHVQIELKRYFLLRLLWNRPITMQSEEVDELWHTFILDTKRYRKFCDLVFGEYLDHESSHFELDPNFESGYESIFGVSLPEIWKTHENKPNYPSGFDFNCA